MPKQYHRMKPRPRLVPALIGAVAIVLLGGCRTHRVMLIGDSFWQRDAIRQGIFDQLRADGIGFDFVGGEGRGAGPAGLVSSATDPDHEAVASKQFIHVLRGRGDVDSRMNLPLADLLKQYDPDVIALQIGINDVYWNFNQPPANFDRSLGRSTEEMLADVAEIARAIDDHNPSAVTLFTTITPVGSGVAHAPAINQRIREYNAELMALVKSLDRQGLNVGLVDSYAAWSGTPQGHVSDDGLHPSRLGNQLLAQAWAAEIQRTLTD